MLLRHRHPVFALRPVPRPGAARRIGGAHRHLPGDAGGPGLPAGPHPRRGPEGHLVGRAHRLGTGRSGRAGALEKGGERRRGRPTCKVSKRRTTVSAKSVC